MTFDPPASIQLWQERLAEHQYIAESSLATAIFLSVKLKKPLFVVSEILRRHGYTRFVRTNLCAAPASPPPGPLGPPQLSLLKLFASGLQGLQFSSGRTA